MINIKDAVDIINQLDVRLDNFSIQDFITGYKIELEHGKINPETNVTNDNPIITAKIALAHLYEYPNYYNAEYELSNFEKQLKQRL